MPVAVKKYNPGFLTDDEIIDSFCVRTAEFESIVESLREMGSSSSTHSLVIGPRGSGKTHLLLRVAAEVRRDPGLSSIFPIVFAEESYEVGTCGEFWLECLAHLAEQAPEDEQASLRLTYEDLRNVSDDRMLAERCLGSLLDFADRHDMRLLLVVENLNMLFSDMSDPDAGWQLRKTLQTEPRIILLGSATSRFHEIDSPEHALYDLFRVLTLRPLDTAECEALWETVSGKPSVGDTVRPLEILTGGSPRLIAIIARFGSDRSFADLMDSLLDLVDEHTEYFKSHLEALPPQERRVYLALARLWKPATAREVAEQARFDTNACSAQLRRLMERGVVAIEGGTPRRRRYYLTERLYNIYYLLRRGVGTDQFIAAVIKFMRCFYSTAELGGIIKDATEYAHVSGILGSFPVQMADDLITEADESQQAGRDVEAIEIYDQIIEGFGPEGTLDTHFHLSKALLGKSRLLWDMGQIDEAIVICSDLLDLIGSPEYRPFPGLVAVISFIKVIGHMKLGEHEAALETCDQALTRAFSNDLTVDLEQSLVGFMGFKGLIYMESKRFPEALAAFDEVLIRLGEAPVDRLTGLAAGALVAKANILGSAGQTISEREFNLLMHYLAKLGDLPPESIEAMLNFAVTTGPARTLDLIQESQAAQMLLPLVTALQQELGESPQVAKEVQEVAEDTRAKLIKLKGELRLGSPTFSGTLSVRKPETT